jgi:hypothetical protein
LQTHKPIVLTSDGSDQTLVGARQAGQWSYIDSVLDSRLTRYLNLANAKPQVIGVLNYSWSMSASDCPEIAGGNNGVRCFPTTREHLWTAANQVIVTSPLKTATDIQNQMAFATNVVNNNYMSSFGRGAAPNELYAWLPYVVDGSVNGPGYDERVATIQRSYQSVFNRLPMNDELNAWLNAVVYIYDDLVASPPRYHFFRVKF